MGPMGFRIAFATVFHDGQKMRPVEESARALASPMASRSDPRNLLWPRPSAVDVGGRYKKGMDRLKAGYNIGADLHQFPEKMLEDEVSVLVLYDGMTVGWFTGVGLPKYFKDDRRRLQRRARRHSSTRPKRSEDITTVQEVAEETSTAPPPGFEDEPYSIQRMKARRWERPEQVVRLTLASDTPPSTERHGRREC